MRCRRPLWSSSSLLRRLINGRAANLRLRAVHSLLPYCTYQRPNITCLAVSLPDRRVRLRTTLHSLSRARSSTLNNGPITSGSRRIKVQRGLPCASACRLGHADEKRLFLSQSWLPACFAGQQRNAAPRDALLSRLLRHSARHARSVEHLLFGVLSMVSSFCRAIFSHLTDGKGPSSAASPRI